MGAGIDAVDLDLVTAVEVAHEFRKGDLAFASGDEINLRRFKDHIDTIGGMVAAGHEYGVWPDLP